MVPDEDVLEICSYTLQQAGNTLYVLARNIINPTPEDRKRMIINTHKAVTEAHAKLTAIVSK